MLYNSGTLFMLVVLGGATFLLILFLVIVGVRGKKNHKSTGLKAFTTLLALGVVALSIMSVFTYYCYIPLNIRFGEYSSVNGGGVAYHMHRDSVSVYVDGQKKEGGQWTLEKDELTILFKGKEYKYTVKEFGTCLYDGDELAYKYVKN